ncbi:MAG TPA: GNAT family N-acetyltransferase [Acidimicrobiia bacterium]
MDEQLTPEPQDEPGIQVDFLLPEGAEGFTRLVRRCYGDSYDAAWVYDPAEVADRLRRGTLWSTVGIAADGEVVAHVGLGRQRPDDDVAESGQAVVDPDYRGRHLFTLLKRRAAAQAAERGLFGLFSEATAAHPYSQRANVALGAVETGLLLGYIPATVEYEAIDAKSHRQSVVLYYLKTNDGHTRPVYAPQRDRRMVETIVQRAGLRGTVRDATDEPSIATTDVHVDDRTDHNDRVVTVRTVGHDLLDAVLVARDDALARAADCVYVDLPLADPGTQRHGDGLRELGFTFGGIFPNRLHDCDVLRYQYLDRVTLDTSDIALASDHGRELLDYVTA